MAPMNCNAAKAVSANHSIYKLRKNLRSSTSRNASHYICDQKIANENYWSIFTAIIPRWQTVVISKTKTWQIRMFNPSQEMAISAEFNHSNAWKTIGIMLQDFLH